MKPTSPSAVVRLLPLRGLGGLAHRVADTAALRRGADAKPSFPWVRRRKEHALQILNYHRVTDLADPFLPAMPTEVFRAQIEYLARSMNVVALPEAVARLASRDALEPRSVSITFDDGYADVYEEAFPILKANGVTATVFLVSDYVGPDRVLWYDRVIAAFRTCNRPSFRVPWESGDLDLSSSKARNRSMERTLEALRALPDRERLERADWIWENLRPPGLRLPKRLMLDWQEIGRMAAEGISFGSHTVTHPILSTLSEDQAVRELVDSRRRLETEIGKDVTLLAYPNGKEPDFNATTKALARAAGYAAAVTTLPGVNRPGEDPYELRRDSPWEHRVGHFAARLAWQRFAS